MTTANLKNQERRHQHHGPSKLPARADKALLDFAQYLNSKIAVDPALFGLDVAQQTAFDTLTMMFSGAMSDLEDPIKQSPPYYTAKN